MSLKFYFDLMSQPSRALYMFIRINKLPVVECPVALRNGEHLTDEFEAINPIKKVPAIDDNGFKLSESIAIMKYLATLHSEKVPDNWLPKDPKKHARVNEFLSWQHMNLRLFGSMYFQTRVIRKPMNAGKLENFKGQLDNCLDQIEKVWLSDGKHRFMNGMNDISVADLLAVCELEQPIAAGYDVCEGRPVLKQYMERVKSKLGPLYEDAHTHARRVNSAVLSGKL